MTAHLRKSRSKGRNTNKVTDPIANVSLPGLASSWTRRREDFAMIGSPFGRCFFAADHSGAAADDLDPRT
jgi:hypothetical protein